MTGSSGEPAVREINADTELPSTSARTASTDTSVARSVVARIPEIWRSAVLALALAVLLVVFLIDVQPVVRYGTGLVVFALYMWWFVTTVVAVLNRVRE